jgi:hypothetical protein
MLGKDITKANALTCIEDAMPESVKLKLMELTKNIL